jgi:alpha-D-ribose 1-methylphosphonate 5-triphosphate synthase subunit PhnH
MKTTTRFVSGTELNFRIDAADVIWVSRSKFLTAWRKTRRSLFTLLAGQSEPKIWQTVDRAGIVWHVYDPVTGSSADFISEQEVRVWLEQRYAL